MFTATRPVRKLGSAGPDIFPLALGCMGMSGMYGPSDEAESLATIHAATDAGINLIDTGDFYGMGHNEMLVGRAVHLEREEVLLSVKFGAQRGPDGSWLGYDARPAAVKTALAYSLKRLGTDYIDIYRPARLDPKVPIEDTIGAIADMVKAGYVRYIGLSEVGPDTIRRAATVHPIVDLQIEYSLISRGPEANIFPVLRELGIASTVYGVLSRGLLSGSQTTGQGDLRAHFPRFQGENRARNERMVDQLRQIAEARGITQVQLAIAWALSKGDFVIPAIGARTRVQLAESLDAHTVKLTAEEIAAVEAAIPPESVAGTRYGEEQMRVLDSERPSTPERPPHSTRAKSPLLQQVWQRAHPTGKEAPMIKGPKPTHTQPGGFEDPEQSEDEVVNDSFGTVDTADSTGSDEDLETGDAKANNLDTHED
jgi:aryl-alcohol dehydrogenase-like predicted oxidoreductase